VGGIATRQATALAMPKTPLVEEAEANSVRAYQVECEVYDTKTITGPRSRGQEQ